MNKSSDGFVSKYVNRQMLVLLTLTGMAITLFVIPHCPTLLTFFVVVGVVGFVSGIYDSSQVVWIIEIWQEKSGPFILGQHLFFAIGCIIPSILIAPFLSNDKITSTDGSESKIYIPFTILGVITTLALLFQVLLFMFCRYYTPPMYANEKSKEVTSGNTSEMEPTSEENNEQSTSILGMNKRKLQLIVISAVFLGAYQGMEICTLQFVPIFGQYSDLQMTESASAYVLSGLTGMYAVGRAVGLILIFKVQPETILCVNFVFVVIANLILLVWASSDLTMFWIGCIVLGAGYSTMFPAFCAFMEKYLVFTNAIGSFFCVVGSIFASIYPLIVGHLINKRAVVLTYTNFFSTMLCLSAIFCAYMLVRKAKTRV